MELFSELVSLSFIFTVHKLLNLASKAVEGPSSLPCSDQVGNDHFQPVSILNSSIEAHTADETLESSLNLGSLAIDEDHLLFMSKGLLSKFSLNLDLSIKVPTEVFLDLPSTIILPQEVNFCLLCWLA